MNTVEEAKVDRGFNLIFYYFMIYMQAIPSEDRRSRLTDGSIGSKQDQAADLQI